MINGVCPLSGESRQTRYGNENRRYILFRLFHGTELYVFPDYRDWFPALKGTALTDRLITTALREYGCRDGVLCRTEKGKPYVAGNRVFLSASHSGGFFACLIGTVPLGVDVQKERRTKTDRIAARYFTEGEKNFVKEKGKAGFFVLWTRKEAYCKYTGKGLEEILSGSPVLGREDVTFWDIIIEEGVYCSCCMKK